MTALMATETEEPLLTVHEVARLLRVRERWLYDATRRGDFPCVRVGRYLRFRRDEVERWIRDGGHA